MRLCSACAECRKAKATLLMRVEVCVHNEESACPLPDVHTGWANYNPKLTCGRSKVFSLFV